MPISARRVAAERQSHQHLWVIVFGQICGKMEVSRRNAAVFGIIQLPWAKGETMNVHQHAGDESRFPLAQEQSQSERDEEARKIRRLQVMISMVMSVIGQDPNLSVEEASELAAGAKRAALAMFPDKELAYDLLYKPRLQRLIRERFRLQ